VEAKVEFRPSRVPEGLVVGPTPVRRGRPLLVLGGILVLSLVSWALLGIGVWLVLRAA